MNKKSVWIYIEGGSVGRVADGEFRKGWKAFTTELRQFAQQHGFHSVEVVRGKGRSGTFDLFKNSPTTKPGELCVLLVDSEEQFKGEKSVWDVVKEREGDKWDKPSWATDNHLYLMKATTETWLLTDQEALKKFFGSDFKVSGLPTTELEDRDKKDVERALVTASTPCKKKNYKHGHAHLIIGLVRPERVKTLSHGQRFFEGVAALIQDK